MFFIALWVPCLHSLNIGVICLINAWSMNSFLLSPGAILIGSGTSGSICFKSSSRVLSVSVWLVNLWSCIHFQGRYGYTELIYEFSCDPPIVVWKNLESRNFPWISLLMCFTYLPLCDGCSRITVLAFGCKFRVLIVFR